MQLKSWFRYLAGALMCAVAIGAAFSLHAQGRSPVKIVTLGASNTQGWGVMASEAYPARLQALLIARGLEAVVLNAGIAGDTTRGMLARLDRTVPEGVDLVILQPGTNDERMGLGAERAANIEAIRTRLVARNIKLIVIENADLDALPRGELRDDGVHFTPAGYAILAERVLGQVFAALGK